MRTRRLTTVCLLLAALAPAIPAQEEPAPKPLVTVESIDVQPANPAADTLCRLKVKIKNEGSEFASQLGFRVSINGQDLGVYGNQLFMYPIPAGGSEEFHLYNFWTTETSRPDPPADGKLKVEVTLVEAIWAKRSTETDDEGEIEVWTPIGPVEGLPSSAALTLTMAGAPAAGP